MTSNGQKKVEQCSAHIFCILYPYALSVYIYHIHELGTMSNNLLDCVQNIETPWGHPYGIISCSFQCHPSPHITCWHIKPWVAVSLPPWFPHITDQIEGLFKDLFRTKCHIIRTFMWYFTMQISQKWFTHTVRHTRTETHIYRENFAHSLVFGHSSHWIGDFFTFWKRRIFPGLKKSTHWGTVMHICISKLTITDLDNGLSPGRHQAIIWTKAMLEYC